VSPHASGQASAFLRHSLPQSVALTNGSESRELGHTPQDT